MAFTAKALSAPPAELYRLGIGWFNSLISSMPVMKVYTLSYNPTSVAANTVSRQTTTVSGLTTSDVLIVNPPSLTSGLNLISYRVSAADTIELVFWNSTGSPIDEGAGTYNIISIRK